MLKGVLEMVNPIKERSYFIFILLGIVTFGIYPIVFWTKFSNDVNKVCDGDGRKTMKFVFVWLLNFVTLGIFGLVWKVMLGQRLKANAPRYDLKTSESGALVLIYTLFIPVIGFMIGQAILIKNFNKLARAYNEYNGLEDVQANLRSKLFVDED